MANGGNTTEKARVCLGLLAHVDAGKTTLTEALLYRGGALRKLGRVDHGDAFLDTDALERERGITIFSKMAALELEGVDFTLLDTPGHVDFSAETERVLSVLDCAVLVISGADGVQAHTRTLWGLLARYRVPTFLFVNKMDQPGTDRAALLAALQSQLDPGCLDFALTPGELSEAAATQSEGALNEYLETGSLSRDTLRGLIGERKVFPVAFGSALKLEGVDAFLALLEEYAPRPAWGEDFSARVFKITRDGAGARLSWMKITGGSLKVKAALATGPEGETEKADQLRRYSGEKYTLLEEAPAGTVCAVTGLGNTFAGQALGGAAPSRKPALEAVLRYEVILPEGASVHTALAQLRTLEEEDPQLHIDWNAALQQIHLRFMGEVQLEILQRVIADRFGLEVTFGKAGIVYRETIRDTVEGVGHFEPLRHYAEVHLLLQPLPRGSGLVFDSVLSLDLLDRNWQRLVLTHLGEKTHLGVLTGSPITDMRIGLAAGAASVKHTEGGDFREATYRAVRQGLMQAESVLLEPWADFVLTLPAEQVGRALADLTRMAARVDPPQPGEDLAVLTGNAPVAELVGYPAQVTAYTHGRGSLATTFRGYEECHDAKDVIARAGYDPERDLENTPDSVFCAHGAGFPVKWNEVPGYMHLESVLAPVREEEDAPEGWAEEAVRRGTEKYQSAQAQDSELQAIFEQTYGKIKRRDILPEEERRRFVPPRPKSILDKDTVKLKERLEGPEYLLVDGYNIIFAWEDLRRLSERSIEDARKALMDILADLRGLKQNQVILVYDAYKVPGGTGSVTEYHGISVVYTKEAETADAYIEKTAHKLRRDKTAKVFVATSDGPEQLIILGAGAMRMTAAELRAEVDSARLQVKDIITDGQLRDRGMSLREVLEQQKTDP